jgi:Cu+-exporting ATPase
MSCAACAARVERSLNKLEGVRASVNYATEKASVALSARVSVADLVAQVERAGYRAAAVETAEPEVDRVGYLWRRLVVALLFGAPLGDLSLATALSPSIRFAGWQWVLLALTAPIALWCAWPFHRNAVVAAYHRTTSMDTLGSLGIVAASSWSIYTAFAHADVHRSVDGRWGVLFSPAGSVYLDVVAAVTVFVLAGRMVEARAKRSAGSALTALGAVAAKDATLLEADDTERRVPVAALRVGDRFVVRAGGVMKPPANTLLCASVAQWRKSPITDG